MCITSRYGPATAADSLIVERIWSPRLSALRITPDAAVESFTSSLAHFGLFDAGSILSFVGAKDAVRRIACSVLAAYRPNPYHNWRHAFLAAHTMFLLLERTHKFESRVRSLRPVDILAALIAALGHDVDHRGRTNSFENATVSDLSLRYNTPSVLEHHHCAVLFEILRGCSKDPRCPSDNDLLNGLHLSRPLFSELRRVIVACIISTDMLHHTEVLELVQHAGSALAPEHALVAFIHACDLSGPTSPDFAEAYEWCDRVNAEFHAQVADEVAAGLPSSPFMLSLDHVNVRAKQQLVFIDYVALPFWAAVVAAFPSAPLAELAAPILSHQHRYQQICDTGKEPDEAVKSGKWPTAYDRDIFQTPV